MTVSSIRAVFAYPYRQADERRRTLFNFTGKWNDEHHPEFAAYTGPSPDGPFNRGAAINAAVRLADHYSPDWEVVIATDTDNICDPAMLKAACWDARETGCVVYPFETYTYLDEYTSDRLIYQDSWFVAPEVHPSRLYRTTVRRHHYSGIQVIPRFAWEAVGGFIELTGWGAEDAIMDTVFRVFARGSLWMEGGAFHLWHPAKRNDPADRCNVHNHQVWSKVQHIAKRPDAKNQLRKYLHSIGYQVGGDAS